VRGRGPHPEPVADTMMATVSALVQLVDAWRDGLDREAPMTADALLMLRDAADQVSCVLRSRMPGCRLTRSAG